MSKQKQTEAPVNLLALVRDAEVYATYAVSLRGRTPIMGGVPKSPDVIAAWLGTRSGATKELEATVEAMKAGDRAGGPEGAAELAAAVEAEAQKTWNGFRSDETGLYLRAYQINAMFKEVATTLGLTNAVRGSRQVLQHGFFVRGSDASGKRVYILGADGDAVTAPTGYEDSTVHAMTPQGKIAALRRNDYVFPWTLAFTVDVIDPAAYVRRFNAKATPGAKVGDAYMATVLRGAESNGLGANRTGDFGTFEVTRLERTTASAAVVTDAIGDAEDDAA